jgi:hypothetical protein
MKLARSFVIVGLFLTPARSVVADVSIPGPVEKPESQPNIDQMGSLEVTKENSPLSPSKTSWFSAGVRFGIFPPVLTALEVSLRPVDHIAFSAYGIFLSHDGGQLLIATSVTAESGKRDQSGWYLSTGVIHASTNSGHISETIVLVPITGGYLFKSGHFELQLGGGVELVLADHRNAPACTGWGCVNLATPPVLPAVDLAFRYRF